MERGTRRREPGEIPEERRGRRKEGEESREKEGWKTKNQEDRQGDERGRERPRQGLCSGGG